MSHRFERLRARAAEHLQHQQWEPAAIRLETLLAERPDDDLARLDVAHAWLRLDRVRDARRAVLQACERERDATALAVPRLEALRAFAEHEPMHAIGAAVDPRGMPADESLRGAMALHGIGATRSARAWFDASLALDPGNAMARVNRAWLDLAEGRFEAAEAELEAIAALDPPMPLAHWLLAGLRRQRPGANHVERLRALLARPGLAPRDAAPLAFALHKECDDLERFDEAWDALALACRLRRTSFATGAALEDDFTDELIARFGPMSPLAKRTPVDGPTPIFIVGMHRSGTTLLERMLEGHPAVAAGGESQRVAAWLHDATDHRPAGLLDATTLSRFAGLDALKHGDAYVERHAWLAAGRSHFTEKEPENFRLVGLLRRALPQARVLHMVRDPMATCWSNLREMYAEGRRAWTYDQRELAAHHLRYRRLMRHWHASCPGYVHDVHYEALVRDPESELRRALESCGLDFHPECLRVERAAGTVRTASAVQARQPVHDRGTPHWKNYAAVLRPLRDALDTSRNLPAETTKTM